MKLFAVKTLEKEHGGCKDVVFYWFKAEEKSGARPYHELTADYSPEDEHIGYAEGAIDEYFTQDEAEQLAAYLDGIGSGPTTITEVSLPIANNILGYGALPVGGGDDFYMPAKRPDYTLPFAVWGYFDLRGCRLIDGSGIFEHRFLEFNTRDGTARVVGEITPLH